ncbi:MAG: C_GCAxxG_C_C family protein [Deltaproteobacteria bacterium]|nr:C_GCAxxG_C_C family protein [Deltaproteobacteria bacterium]
MLSRRKFLGFSVALGGMAAQTLVWGLMANGETNTIPTSQTQGLWTYHPVDPITAAKLAYEGHSKNGCSYGVFYGIVGQLAEAYGEPYRSFPFKMMKFGNSGIGDSGNICGGLVGGSAAIGLFLDGITRIETIKSLLQWYENTELPVYQPSKSLKIDGKIPAVKAQTTLCSNSKAAWCKKSGFGPDSKERIERCFRLSADTCKKTAELLNAAIGE